MGAGQAVLAGGFALCVLAGPCAAERQVWRFDWQGAGGYAMRGALAFDSAAIQSGYVLEPDVDCFFIEGFRDGKAIGRWALGMLSEDTTWVMTFNSAAGGFVVFGPEAPMPQAWNMDGFGTDCGEKGFGFNIGNAAQDMCLDGRLLVESQIDPERPFPAVRDDGFAFPSDGCIGPPVISLLALPARHG